MGVYNSGYALIVLKNYSVLLKSEFVFLDHIKKQQQEESGNMKLGIDLQSVLKSGIVSKGEVTESGLNISKSAIKNDKGQKNQNENGKIILSFPIKETNLN